MRTSFVVLSAIFALSLAPAVRADRTLDQIASPGAVAVSEDSAGHLVFKSFPSFLPLYIFEGDHPGKSTCNDICTAVWPILRARDDDKAMGPWTVIKRDDGRKQWAYKGKPVYTYFDDSPDVAMGVGKEVGWYLKQENWYLEPKDTRPPKVSAKKPGALPTWQLLEP
jgi:predicted lipoprotein with Yx(FWY)xxD motif